MMEQGRMAFVFFYGVFWCSALSVVRRYHPFETTAFYSRRRWRFALARFVVCFVFVNVFPVVWFFVLYYVVPNRAGLLTVLCAATAATSVFGFHRILHGIIAAKGTHSCFYASDEEWKQVLKEWAGRGENTFKTHVVPGLAYLALFGGLAKALSRFC